MFSNGLRLETRPPETREETAVDNDVLRKGRVPSPSHCFAVGPFLSPEGRGVGLVQAG